jgi:hypothetical protein
MGILFSKPTPYRFYQQHLYDLIQTYFTNDNHEVVIPIKSPDPSVELLLQLSYRKLITDQLNIFGLDVVIILKQEDFFYHSQPTTLIVNAYHYNENLKSGAILYKLQHKGFKITFDALTLNYSLNLIFDPDNEHDCFLRKEDIIFVLEPTADCVQLYVDQFKEQK